jgi:hypothetical protein
MLRLWGTSCWEVLYAHAWQHGVGLMWNGRASVLFSDDFAGSAHVDFAQRLLIIIRPGSEAWAWVRSARAQPVKGSTIFVRIYIYEVCSSMSPSSLLCLIFWLAQSFLWIKLHNSSPNQYGVCSCFSSQFPKGRNAMEKVGMKWEGCKFQHSFCNEPKSTCRLTFTALIPFPKIRLISSSNSHCPQLV